MIMTSDVHVRIDKINITFKQTKGIDKIKFDK